MENNLFNQTMLKKYYNKIKLTHKQKETVKEYIKKVENDEFKSETKNYLIFYDIILKELLGYDRDNILFDEKVEDGKGRSEFVIKSSNKKFMVVELKGQGIDLDKKQTRQSDIRTPVDQAFGYAIHTGDVEWIMLSNYDEFRLYNYHEKTNYISFNAKELADTETLKQFLLVFSKKSHIETDYINKIKQETLVVERKLENEFYKLYNETRLMLIKELEEYNGFDRIKAVHYAQLILNRYMFICFAEDQDLLPSQITIDTINRPIKFKDLRGDEIWHRINGLFRDIKEGNEARKVFPYDGVLFNEDLKGIEIRDLIDDYNFFKDTYQKWNFEEYSIEIEDLLEPYGNKINPIYKNLLIISSFDFSSDLDVNILGHIFENSIGDIEELKEDAKGRRKKEGVFYTPEYITDYICKNTIIPYLSISGKSNTVKDLVGEYWGSKIEELDKKVREIKIIDPACGSGAFLNKAADILLEIHESIHKQKYKGKQTLMPFFDNIGKRREILLNNIFGVDLNEESVEITKLSLFLKVCRKDLKLPNLDNNIKCGNSIVDDPEFTDKPLNWEKFDNLVNNNKFDIIIGNPPYVRHHGIKNIKPYLKENYETYTGLSDLYVYFFEKSIKILKNKGRLGFISSNKFIKVNYGKKLRKFILENVNFNRYVDHTYDPIFEDATTYPSVFIFEKGLKAENSILVNNEFELDQSRLDENAWGFERPEILDLKQKIRNNGILIKDIPDLNFHIGIMTGFNKAFIIDEITKNDLLNDDIKNKDIIKPLLTGKDIKRYQIEYKDLYLILSKSGDRTDEEYPTIVNFLKSYEEILKKRWNKGKYWFNLRDCDYYNEFEKPKLIYPEISQKLFATYDENNFYTNAKCFIITSETTNLKYLGGLISSKTLNFFFRFLGAPLQGNSYNLSKSFIEQLPIYFATQKQQYLFIEKTDQLLQFNKTLINETNGFKNWLKHTFKIKKFSKKLNKYYELSLDEFLNELKKKKVNVKSRENYNALSEGFEASLNIINPLLKKIENTDNEIDRMVYEFYGLTEEEIQIIEEI